MTLVNPLHEPGETTEELRARARTFVYERLALLSAVIWTLGTLVLMIAYVPYVARPQAYIAIAMTVPLLPAALPWAFYRPISNAVARRWLATGDSHG